jgi:hypothetical protein
MATVFRAVFFTEADVALATKLVVRRVATAALGTAFRRAVFLELLALLGCLPGCVVIAPSERGTATRASAVRDRRMTWRLKCKLTLSYSYMEFRVRPETNIFHHPRLPVKLSFLLQSIVRPGMGLEGTIAKSLRGL